MSKSPWRKPFDPNIIIPVSAKNETELNMRIADNESRGFVLIERYVESKRGASTTYEKHVARMRRVPECHEQ